MKMLIVGAGVIGTVYGAHLAAAGNDVSVLSHRARTDDVASRGLSAHDVLDGGLVHTKASVVPGAAGDYDVVLVAVRRDQLVSACAGLAGLGSAFSRHSLPVAAPDTLTPNRTARAWHRNRRTARRLRHGPNRPGNRH